MSVIDSPDETKFIYYLDEEETPYLVKLNIPPERVTLGDFKNALNRPHFKFFFKSLDDDFGVVKEEILDDNAILPCFNGRVISWLVTADGSSTSEFTATGPVEGQVDRVRQRTVLGGATDELSHNANGAAAKAGAGQATPQADSITTGSNPAVVVTSSFCTSSAGGGGKVAGYREPDAESLHSLNQDRIAPLQNFKNYRSGNRNCSAGAAHNQHEDGGSHPAPGYSAGPRPRSRHHHHHQQQHQQGRIELGLVNGSTSWRTYETPVSMLSSDLESSSFIDSEDESSRFSSVTGTTLSSRRYGRFRQRRRRRRRPPPPITRASSFSSMTDSTMSLNIVSVTLNMDTVNFLGISIVGQSNKAGDGGIYVGSIMEGGAVAQDGRIEPGDMILEVNGISFEEMSNDDAVRTLREQVKHPGPITLVVAKCWEPNNHGGFFTLPRQEPVRPIDPRAWVIQTNALANGTATGTGGGHPVSPGGSSSTLSPSGCEGGVGAGAGDLTSGMSMATLTSGQTSMPLGTSAAAYNMAASLLAAASLRQQRQRQLNSMKQQGQHEIQPGHHHHHHLQQGVPLAAMLSSGLVPQCAPVSFHHHHHHQHQNQQHLMASQQMAAASAVTGSSSLPDMEQQYSEPRPLTTTTPVSAVLRAMVQPDSGLEIRDRVWLKLAVPSAFIGSDLVDWLYRHVEGFADRRSARQYASNLLKSGYIRHTVNKTTFSEQCYYVFGDITSRLSCISLEQVESVSEVGSPPTSWVLVAPRNAPPISVGLPPLHSNQQRNLSLFPGLPSGEGVLLAANKNGVHEQVCLPFDNGVGGSGCGNLQLTHAYKQPVIVSQADSSQLVQDDPACRIIPAQRGISGGYSTASSSSADNDVYAGQYHVDDTRLVVVGAPPLTPAPSQLMADPNGDGNPRVQQSMNKPLAPTTATGPGSSSSGQSDSSYTSGVLVPGDLITGASQPQHPPPPPPRISTLPTRS